MQAQTAFHRLHRVVMACWRCAGALLGAGLMPPGAGGRLRERVRANPSPKRRASLPRPATGSGVAHQCVAVVQANAPILCGLAEQLLGWWESYGVVDVAGLQHRTWTP